MQKALQMLRRYKWWFLSAVVLIAAGSYAYYYMQQQNKPQVSGRPVKVERSDIIAIVSATGTLSPVNKVDVSSKITGLIEEVRVNENDRVKKDQILIILDDKKLAAQVEQSRARLANATANYERARKMNQVGAYSNQQLDAARMDYDVAKAAYDDATSNLADTVIRAPIDGMVIGKPIPAGQTVSPGISNPMVLLTVADLGQMQIEALIDESDIGKVKVGQKVTFTVDAYTDKTFTGKVAIISNKANVQQNVVYYTVYIDVDSPEGLLKPTMTARVSVRIGERNNVVAVPILALKDNKGQRFVNVLKDGQIQAVRVSTGLASEDQIEVTKGLEAGQTILLPQARTGAGGVGGPGGPGGTNIFRQSSGPSR